MKPTSAFKERLSALQPRKKFFAEARRVASLATAGDTVVLVLESENGDLTPVDFDESDYAPGNYVLYKNGDVFMRTTVPSAPEKSALPPGAMRDPQGYMAAGTIQHGTRVFDAQLHSYAQLQQELKDERAQSKRYRDDADKWRDKVMEMAEKVNQMIIADKESKDDDGLMTIAQMLQTGIAAMQGADFRKQLEVRASAALRVANLSEDDHDVISRFLNRDEFKGLWVPPETPLPTQA